MSDEEVSVEDLRGSLKSQMRRIKKLADEGGVDTVAVLREIHQTVLPLIGDLSDLVDRLESHADWATGALNALTGDGAEASQLTPEDAERLHAYVRKTLELVIAPDVLAEGQGLLELIDELRLEDVDDEAPTNGAAAEADPD
jgi:hypothetical protein